MTKRAPSGTLFVRAAYWLDSYASLYKDAGFVEPSWPGGPKEKEEAADNQRDRNEMLELRDRLLEMQGEWERKVAVGGPDGAAVILATMLADWKVPGAVYYRPASKRYRLTGEGYAPGPDEVCAGVYMPGVDPAAMADDLREVAKE